MTKLQYTLTLLLAAPLFIQLLRAAILWFGFGQRLWRTECFDWRYAIFLLGSVVIHRLGNDLWWILCLWLGWLFLGRIQLWVYEGGVYAATSTIPWRAVRGWAFEQEGARTYLYLWSDSAWRYFDSLFCGRSSWRPVRVEVAYSEDLAAILREYAPERAALRSALRGDLGPHPGV